MKAKEIQPDQTLWHYGLRWVVVTDDTEELVAAFAIVEHAMEFLAIYTPPDD